MPIGVKVTLRRDRMYEFLDRLVNIALPRVRDFRGLSPKSFDGRGNYAMGLKEQIVFPEINYDKVDEIRGMDIVDLHDGARPTSEARALLKGFDLPFAELTADAEETFGHGKKSADREEQEAAQPGEAVRGASARA